MPIKTTLEERIEIMNASERGEPTWRLSRRMGWRASTIRKWRLRGQKEGRAGLVSQMGRPKGGALSSYPAAVRESILRWRVHHPGWGAETLIAELKRHPAFQGQKMPSAASINRFLKEQELVQSYAPQVELPESQRQPDGAAHDIWEMDAQGYTSVADVGMVTLINLNDRASHVRLLSYPCFLGRKRVERHANTVDYQVALRIAFLHWGRPQIIQVDHESIFFDNRSRSPFPTLLHLWLVALGIQLTFSRVGRPTDQGMTERSHQLWSQQVLQGQHFAEWQTLYQALQTRRDFLNQELPCASLNRQPPLVAFPEARFSGRAYRPEYEAELLDLELLFAYLAKGQWFRQVAANGIISLGGQAYYVGTKWHRRQIEVRFEAETQHFLCYDEAGQLIKRLHWKGNLLESLLGEAGACATLPAFQLQLPFSWNEVRNQHFWRMAANASE